MNIAKISKWAGLLLAVSLWGGCAQVGVKRGETAVSATMQGETERPPAAQWLRTELYFATGRVDAGDEVGGSEADWRLFLDREVTPRFPDGFTVFDAYGQWRMSGSDRIGRLRSKVLVILHEDTSAKQALVEEVRVAFKRETGQQSVLRSTSLVEVSF
jgi:hypothetical protein